MTGTWQINIMKNVTLSNKLAVAVAAIAAKRGVAVPALDKVTLDYVDGKVVVLGAEADKEEVQAEIKVSFNTIIEAAARLSQGQFADLTGEEIVERILKEQEERKNRAKLKLEQAEASKASRAAKRVARTVMLKATRAERALQAKVRLAEINAVKATVQCSFDAYRSILGAENNGDKMVAACAYSLYNKEFIKAGRREMMKKDKQVNILGLAATTADGRFEFVSQSLAEQRITRKKGLLDVKEMSLPTGDLEQVCARATEDFMVVNYGQADSEMLNIRKYVLLKVKHDGANTRALASYLVKEEGKLVKKYLDITKQIVVDPSTINEAEYSTYAMVGSTAAGSRTGSVYYYKKGIAIDNILNYSSYGAWNKMLNQRIHVSTANKNLVRIFAGFSSNVDGGEVENYAIYFGNMGRVKDNEKPLDGMLFNSIEIAHIATEKLLDIKAPISVARKFAAQVRPFTTKCFSKTVNKFEMRVLMEAVADGEENIIVLQREDITPEVDAELDLGFKGKGRFAGKVVIVGDPENVQIFSDTNGYKAPFDYKQVSEFSILDLPTDTTAKTSIQLLEKMFAEDKDQTLEVVQSLIEENCGAEIAALAEMSTKIPTLKEAEAGYVHGLTKAIDPEYVTTDRRSYIAEINDTKTRIEKMLNKMKFAVDGLNARIHSDYAAAFGKTFIQPDEVVLCDRIARRLAKAGITHVIGIKYPSVGVKEYFEARVVSWRELEARVRRDNDLTNAQKTCLISMYKHTNDGVAIIGAFGALKDWLAGLDFDYDMICFFFDKRIAKILVGKSKEMVAFDESFEVEGYDKEAVARRQEEKRNKKARKAPVATDMKLEGEGVKVNPFLKAAQTVATEVERNQAKTNIEVVTNELDEQEAVVNLEITFNTTSSHNPFCMFFSFKGVNVGSITNNDLTQVLAMLDPQVMKAMMLRQYGPVKADAKPYVGLPCEDYEITPDYAVKRYVINGALAAKMADQLEVCARDEESLICIFKDLNIVYRYYQELAIDAAKTFIAPFLELCLAQGFKPAILMPATFAKPSVEITIQEFQADYDSKSLKKFYVFNDPLNQLREKALKDLSAAFEMLEAQEFVSPQGLREYWNEKLTDHAQIEGLNYLTSMYRRVTAHYAQATRGLESDSPLRLALNKEKRYYFEAIRNMFVALTPNLNDQMRGSLAKTLNYFQAVQVKGTNSYTLKERANADTITPIAFAETVMGYEYFANICKSPTATPYAGEKVVSGDIVTGETVTFVNGIYRGEAGAAATVAKINGEFKIIENNGHKYAVKPILDVVKRAETTNCVMVQVRDNKVTEELRLFLEAAKENGESAKISNYMANVLGVEFNTTLSGAAKRILDGQEGVIKAVLPMYTVAVENPGEDDEKEIRTLKGLSMVIELPELASYKASSAPVAVADTEKSLEELRALALAKLGGQTAEEAEGTPTALSTPLNADGFDFDDALEVTADEEDSEVVTSVSKLLNGCMSTLSVDDDFAL